MNMEMMESELEQYLNNIGLSTNMLQSTSPEQVDDDAPRTSATASSDDNHEDKDDNDVVEASHPGQPAVDVIAADTTLVNGTTVLVNDDDDDDQLKTSGVSPTVTASLTDSECCTATDCPPTQAAGCDSRSADLVALSSSDNSDDVILPSMPQPLSSADNSSVQSSPQQTVTMNGNKVQLDCSQPAENVTRQSSSTRSAVVFSTVPRHVDKASTLSSSQTSQPTVSSSSSLSSCTIMLTGSTADVVKSSSSPTARRATGDKREAPQIEVAAAARRASPDTMPYTSTIIRCSTSSAPVIATGTSKSRDTDAPAAASAVDNLEASPPAKQHVKTTPNYVSVVQIGSSPSARSPAVNERHVTTMPVDSVNSGSVASQSSPQQTGRQHTNTADAASGTPIKSSLKKVTPSHTKSKSVSFSTGSGDVNDDGVSVPAATTVGIYNVRQPDSHRPGMAETIVRLDRDRVDGIAPRRALVSDSGVFCEPDDDQTTLISDDNRAAATQPSRRTTVIVSGGMASMKNNPKHQQREQLADVAAAELCSEPQDIGRSSNPASARPQQVPALGSSASAYVTDNIVETKHATTQDTTTDIRRTNADTTQASCSLLLLIPLSHRMRWQHGALRQRPPQPAANVRVGNAVIRRRPQSVSNKLNMFNFCRRFLQWI